MALLLDRWEQVNEGHGQVMLLSVLIERWRREYNTFRPHSALDYRPPAPEATELQLPASTSLQLAAALTKEMDSNRGRVAALEQGQDPPLYRPRAAQQGTLAAAGKEDGMDETARLEVDGKSYELPIVTGSEGERAVDIRNLRSETGLITLDPGDKNTGSCQSAITFIDGGQGILRYRGIPIEELAEKSTFLEAAYLLIQGNLPNEGQFKHWVDGITRHTMLHEGPEAALRGVS